MDESSIRKLLESISSRHRARKIKDNIEVIDFLEKLYPGVILNYQIISFLNNVNPYCNVCNLPVKTLYRNTCSSKCSTLLLKSTNVYTTRQIEYKKTNMIKYGVDNPAKCKSVQTKRLETMEKTYGAKVSPKSLTKIKERADDFINKGRVTLLENHGVTNPGKIEGHYSKVVDTMIKHYGVPHYAQSSEFIERMDKRRLDKYNLFAPGTIRIDDIHDDLGKGLIFENPNKVIKFTCTDCNTSGELPSDTYKWRIKEIGTPCIKCSGIVHGSVKENEVREFIQQLGIITVDNKRQLQGLEIDIYCPEYNIGIEFNGLFWHNEARVGKKYHVTKTNLAETAGIRLIHIFEDEWEHKRDIVKSRLRNMFKLNTNTLYARKCIIKEITLDQEKIFLTTNHIQGYSKSSVKLGLFYNDALVSVMTFSKPNKSKGQIKSEGFWELLRFSSLNDTTVIGAANKLFAYFIKKYTPTTILSFSDKRWNTGTIYNTLGFTKQPDTSLGYWYIDLKNIKRIHRFSMRKTDKDDKTKTEYELRLGEGFLRIWDCGNSKWIWTQPRID